MKSKGKDVQYDPAASGVFNHIRWGVRYFFAGFGTLVRHPSLLGLSLVPILFTIIVLLALALGSAWVIGEVFAPSLGNTARIVIQAMTLVLALVLGYFIYMPMARILLAPFSEMLSRKTHSINTGNAGFSTSAGWKRAMIEGLKLILFQLTIIIIIVILGVAFPPGGAVAGFALTTVLAGLDFLDVPLSARGIPLRKKLGILWRNKSLAIGFGLAAHLMLIIPGINLFLLPAGVIGATLLTDTLETADRL